MIDGIHGKNDAGCVVAVGYASVSVADVECEERSDSPSVAAAGEIVTTRNPKKPTPPMIPTK